MTWRLFVTLIFAGISDIFVNVDAEKVYGFMCGAKATTNRGTFDEHHPSLIHAAIRRPNKNKEESKWTLFVMHRNITNEAPLDHMRPSSTSDMSTIRLFVKPRGNFVVGYQTTNDQTVIAYYHIGYIGKGFEIVKDSSFVLNEQIELWRMTDSDEGFYDSVTCERMDESRKRLTDCDRKCHVKVSDDQYCIYDAPEKRYMNHSRTKFRAFYDYPPFNSYFCMIFHEVGNGTAYMDVGSTSLVTNHMDIDLGDTVVCFDTVLNTRFNQYYDLRWDDSKPSCDPVEAARISFVPQPPVTKAPVLPAPSRRTVYVAQRQKPYILVWLLSWLRKCVFHKWWVILAAFAVDGLILAICIVILTLSVIGRRSKNEMEDENTEYSAKTTATERNTKTTATTFTVTEM